MTEINQITSESPQNWTFNYRLDRLEQPIESDGFDQRQIGVCRPPTVLGFIPTRKHNHPWARHEHAQPF
jgi:hypothetical protein